MQPTESKEAFHRKSERFGVALLFYLVAISAILSASLRVLVIDDSITSESLAFGIAVGIGVGIGLGISSGIFYFRRGSAYLFGTLVGFVVGSLAGAMSQIRFEYLKQVIPIVFVGCWLLIAFILISARFRKLEA